MKRALLLCWLSSCATTPQASPVAQPVTERPATPVPPSSAWVRSLPPAPLAPMPRSLPKTRSITLKNGLRVVVVEDHRSRLVQTRLFLPSGSAADAADQAGATWFALALLGDTFDERDSDERPVRPLEESARYLAMMAGARLHFDVTPDSAWLGLDGYSVDTATLLRRLDTVVTQRRHGEDSFQARAQSVADMVNELELSDGLVLEQYLTQLAFGADHPYARLIFGNTRSIARIGIEDIVERQNQLLTPVGSTLLVGGDVVADDVFHAARLAFSDWKGSAHAPVVISAPSVTKRKSVIFLPRKPSRNTLICLARPLTDVKASSAALELAVSVLGQARISAVLREKLGLTYSVTAGLVERRAARALLICARVKATETVNATRLMLEELAALGSTPPTAEELERARAMAITEHETAMDDLRGIVEAWRRASVMKRSEPSPTELAELRQVTVEDLAAVARRVSELDTVQLIFSGERPLVEASSRASALGPLKVPTLERVTE